MQISNGDGTYTVGPLDIVLIYHNVEEGTFHPAFYEEAPLPGPVVPMDETVIVRLKSSMHHTQGFPTLEEAQEDIRKNLQRQLTLKDENIVFEPAMPWDGTIGDTMVVGNWRAKGGSITSELSGMLKVPID